MPPAGRGSCGDLHNSLRLWETLQVLPGSERKGYSPLSGFELLLDWHPDPAKFAKVLKSGPYRQI